MAKRIFAAYKRVEDREDDVARTGEKHKVAKQNLADAEETLHDLIAEARSGQRALFDNANGEPDAKSAAAGK
jgi:hypothetical protein